MKLNRQRLFEVAILVLCGLIPLLWFPGNSVILGHDSGLTLAPVSHFVDRLYAWTDRFAFGVDQTYAIPGFFIHGIEALLGVIGFSLQGIQKVSFVFWFLLPGVSMYLLGRRIERVYNLAYFALPASLFFMMNHFLLQAWFVAERTKFSLYVALPLFILLLFDWKDGRRSTFRSAIFISILFFFLNGEASIPLFGSLILTALLFLGFYVIAGVTKKRLVSLASLAGLTGLFTFALQAYWLLPYGYYITHNFTKEVAVAGGLSGILTWVKYISENTSLTNLFRLQGIPDWYQNPFHPYAKNFLTNPILIGISYLLPIVAFSALYWYRKSKARVVVLFFAALSLLSLVFMAGSHPPFGPLYVLFVKFIPGFIAFRTPFYKFASSLWFAYAILIAFSLSYFATAVVKKETIKQTLVYIFVPVFILLYNYPLLNGAFFDYIYKTRSTRVTVPQYVYNFGEWSMKPENREERTLLLPPTNKSFRVDAYSWGYWSLAPVTTLLTTAPFVTESYYGNQRENRFLSILYEKMENNDPTWKSVARYLGISRFLLRNDFVWNLPESPTAPPHAFKKALGDADVSKLSSFGKWDVYALTASDDVSARARQTDVIDIVIGDVDAIDQLVRLPGFSENTAYYFAESTSSIPTELKGFIDGMYSYPECINCNLQYSFQRLDLEPPLLTKSSKLYFLTTIQDSLQKRKETLQSLLERGLKDTLEYKAIIISGRSETYIDASLKDLYQALQLFEKKFAKEGVGLPNSEIMQLENTLRVMLLILDGEKEKIASRELRQDVVDEVALIAKNREIVGKYLWETTEENEIKFLLDVPKTGTYQLLYRTDNPNSPQSFVVDGKQIEGMQAREADTVVLSDISLSQGLRKLLINDTPHSEYVVDDITPIDSTSCMPTQKIPLHKDSFYRMTFEYMTAENEKVSFRFNQSNAAMGKGEEVLSSSNDWREYSKDFATLSASHITFSFCEQGANQISSGNIRYINFRKIRTPQVLLYQKGVSATNIVKPLIKKTDPTSYTLTSSGTSDSLLILNEAYSDQWRTSDSVRHFEANGYANGWVVRKGQEYTVEYVIQKLVMIGFGITGVTFFGLIFYLLKQKYAK